MNRLTEFLSQNANDAGFFDHQRGSFFRRIDWLAFAVSLFIMLAVYVYTLAPTVTLEDSGELAVASDYLGVPHPPGYPIWTLLSWFTQWVFRFVTYHGQPNPAWGVGLASAMPGAFACALLALLVSRSGADMLRGLKMTTRVIGTPAENTICWTAGVSAALLFGLAPVMWSQSVIVEVYSLNALFLMLIVVLLYFWMERPASHEAIWAISFLFALGLTNHQSLMFLAPAIVVAVGIKDLRLFRDFFIVGIFLLIMLGINGWAAGQGKDFEHLLWNRGWDHPAFWWWNAYMIVIPTIALFVLPKGKIVGTAYLLVLLGLSFNFFMPIASEQNPPINWGYPRTWEGFMHAITRGQYEQISPLDNLQVALADPMRFLRQIHAIITNPFNHFSVFAQFTWLLTPLGFVPFFFMPLISRKILLWLITSLVGFLSLTVLFIVFQDPQFDVQTLFIMRVQYVQAHAVYALWIGYGLAFLMAFIDTLARGNKAVKNTVLAVTLALPLILVYRNAFDRQFLKIHGACDQRGHTFGWQFGNWQLRGVHGIRDDLRHWLSPEEFEQVWADYPTPDYPPEMGPGAIFFGGTDPGRFVPTYMIYCADVRPDVYLITQNALADNTYMNVMRDRMGDEIWIPSQTDSNLAFQQYVRDIQEGNIPPGAEVTFQDGRVSVQGVQGVMMINGILCRMIFDHNKHKHDFYIEESYVIPWMYEYMTPHGLILKINKEPLDRIPPELVEKDHLFWKWYVERLLDDRKFLRDVVARKTFSKLRSAIAGLYAYRNLFDEAEYAFQQAIDLYPLSPEANFRLADILMQRRQFSKAVSVIETFLEKDPGNERVAEYLGQIRNAQTADVRRIQLESIMHSGEAVDVGVAFELAQIYRMLNMMSEYRNITRNIVLQDGLPPEITLQVAQLHAQANQVHLLEEALRRYIERVPGNWHTRIDLAAVLFSLNRNREGYAALEKAVELGGAEARDRIRAEQVFDPVRDQPEFQRLVPPVQQGLRLPMGFQ